jgi:hypothetical protein
LEGHVWGLPRLGNIARFESDEDAKRVLLSAGFEYVERVKGFFVFRLTGLNMFLKSLWGTKSPLVDFEETACQFIVVGYVTGRALSFKNCARAKRAILDGLWYGPHSQE